ALDNIGKFVETLGINPEKIIRADQQHTNNVIIIDNLTKDYGSIKADGMITNKKGIYLYLKTADCHAIGFFDYKKNTIGLVHAGRVGLEKEILKKAVEKMVKEFGSDPKQIMVQFGPSIGPCCYGPFYLEKSSEIVKKYLIKKG